MTIWILAVLIMVSVALAGWRQGAIRAAFSFVGILVAALLAVPVGRIFQPLLPHLGAGNPVLAKLGLESQATAAQPGGNMEGKEVRFGIVN